MVDYDLEQKIENIRSTLSKLGLFLKDEENNSKVQTPATLITRDSIKSPLNHFEEDRASALEAILKQKDETIQALVKDKKALTERMNQHLKNLEDTRQKLKDSKSMNEFLTQENKTLKANNHSTAENKHLHSKIQKLKSELKEANASNFYAKDKLVYELQCERVNLLREISDLQQQLYLKTDEIRKSLGSPELKSATSNSVPKSKYPKKLKKLLEVDNSKDLYIKVKEIKRFFDKHQEYFELFRKISKAINDFSPEAPSSSPGFIWKFFNSILRKYMQLNFRLQGLKNQGKLN